MLIEALLAAGDLGRLHEIGRVLIRHGFGDFVQRTGIASVLARAGQALRLHIPKHEPLPLPARARLALEELGPTFVKLGQLMASRHDMLPPEWIEEFSRLHSRVGSVPFEQVRQQLEEDLGASALERFESFDEVPMAAGSIAQVYAASLRGEGEVVVKVRRPGIEAVVQADLRLLARLAELVESELRELRRFRPKQLLRQFARSLRGELDMRLEARNLGMIAGDFEAEERVVFPRVIASFTRERLMVQTRLRGLSASDFMSGARPLEFDAQGFARTGADLFMRMVFEHGRYHADPHPGNVLLMAGGRVGLIDFGMVGRLGDRRRRELLALMAAVVRRDEEVLVEVLLDWAEGRGPVPLELAQEVSSFLDIHHGRELGEVDVGAMLLDVAEIMRQQELQLPSDVAMLIKLFVTLEGLGRGLDPHFNLALSLEPIARSLYLRERKPRALLRRSLRELRLVLAQLPADVKGIVMQLRRGGLRMDLDLERLERLGQQVERSANRITVGLVTAALIVGTSVVMTVDRGPTLLGFPVLGLVGFLSSFGVGMGLLWSIMRSGR